MEEKPITELLYICPECAEALGWTWPERHVSTWHYGICDQCEKVKGICARRNWITPR